MRKERKKEKERMKKIKEMSARHRPVIYTDDFADLKDNHGRLAK